MDKDQNNDDIKTKDDVVNLASLDPTYDSMIKVLFGRDTPESKAALMDFTHEITGNTITSITLLNPLALPGWEKERKGEMDIVFSDQEGRVYDLEMQREVNDVEEITCKMLLYHGELVRSNAGKVGEDCKKMKEVYTIMILKSGWLVEKGPEALHHLVYIDEKTGKRLKYERDHLFLLNLGNAGNPNDGLSCHGRDYCLFLDRYWNNPEMMAELIKRTPVLFQIYKELYGAMTQSAVKSFLEFIDYYNRLFEKGAQEERLKEALQKERREAAEKEKEAVQKVRREAAEKEKEARKQEALDRDIKHTLSSHAVGNSPEQISMIIDRPVSWVIETLKANGVEGLD